MNIKRIIKYYFIRLLRQKSDAKDVSLGLAIGFVPNWYPTFGLGPIISIALAKIFRTNLVSAFIGGISGSIIWPFLFYLNYKVGNFVLHFGSNITGKINGRHLESVNLFYYKTKTIGFDFFIGSVINVVVFGIIIYFVCYIIFSKYRAFYLRIMKKKNNLDK